MTIVGDVVGIMLPGAPSAGDPRGVRDWQARGGVLNLTAAVALRISARRIPIVTGPIFVFARVFTEFGDFYMSAVEDQSKLIPNTWHTRLTLDI